MQGAMVVIELVKLFIETSKKKYSGADAKGLMGLAIFSTQWISSSFNVASFTVPIIHKCIKLGHIKDNYCL